ncbi:MAG TPA: transposase [Candidatus Angelobacter sp.]
MPKGLRRIQGGGDRHFITCSCYRRQAFLGSARRRDIFLSILDEVRSKYGFVVWGYVIMPEHIHLLVTEPRKEKLSKAMQVLKQRVSLRCRRKRRSTEQLGIWSDEPPAFGQLLGCGWKPRPLWPG